jgi:hypothetical protein
MFIISITIPIAIVIIAVVELVFAYQVKLFKGGKNLKISPMQCQVIGVFSLAERVCSGIFAGFFLFNILVFGRNGGFALIFDIGINSIFAIIASIIMFILAEISYRFCKC